MVSRGSVHLPIGSNGGDIKAYCLLAATVAIVLLATSVSIIHHSSEVEGGGLGDTAGAREVLLKESDTSGNPSKFIDAEGDARLIYTAVSDTEDEKSVRITDIERNLGDSSYTTFPDEITYDGNTYDVVGNKVVANGNNVFVDAEGVFKLKYEIKEIDPNKKVLGAVITGTAYSGSEAVPAIFPPEITDPDGNTYKVAYVDENAFDSNAKISDLTIIVPDTSDLYLVDPLPYALFPSILKENKSLTSLKFVVDGDDPESSAKLMIISAYYSESWTFFDSCSNLAHLELPNGIQLQKYYPTHTNLKFFANCTSLGTDPDDPLVFNTKFTFRYSGTCFVQLFSGCSGIINFEIGTNAEQTYFQVSSEGRYPLSDCPNLKVIYNASTGVTEEDLAKVIVNSGSYNVLLYNLGGGKLTRQTAIADTASAEGADRSWDITLPEATFNGKNIPSWCHNGSVRYESNGEYSSFSPWGTDQTGYSYYYYSLDGTCTITYHVTYKGSDGKTYTDTQTQRVACMYNTLLYDKDTYPAEAVRKSMADEDFKWTGLTGITYFPGQSVTLLGSLDLYLWLDNTTKESVAVTYEWNYITASDDGSAPTVTTYTLSNYTAATPGKIVLASIDSFVNNATDASGNTMDSDTQTAFKNSFFRWISPDGNSYMNQDSIYAYGRVTLTAVLKTASFAQHYIWYRSTNDDSPDRFFIATSSSVAIPNPYLKNGYIFDRWNTMYDGSGVSYYPGDEIPSSVNMLIAIWKDSTKNNVVAEYNLYKKEDSGPYITGKGEFDYKDLSKLHTFSRQGYSLVGWSFTENGNTDFSIDAPIMMLNNLRLYAVWEKIPTVIADNLLYSVDEVPSGDYDPGFLFIGKLTLGDKVRLTVTFYDSAGNMVEGNKPTDAGIYTMWIGYQVFRGSADVTGEYYSRYEEGVPVVENCYHGFLTIYDGSSTSVIA